MPEHIGFIIDGNRRWAKKRGLATIFGHRRGYEQLKKVGDWCIERGIKILTVYTFSCENWERPKVEVSYLMGLVKRLLKRDIWELHEKGIRLKVIGRLHGLSKELQTLVQKAEELTRNNKRGVLNLALNYGGRAEIVDMVKSLIREKFAPERVTENVISEHLYTEGIQDPELIIRTSGEQRLSGFLPWQCAYSEFIFSPRMWPDFSERDLDEALLEYHRRERRFGK